MLKQQQQRYQVFLKVRDFGARHQDQFPASSPAGRAFATVAEAAATIDRQASDRLVQAQAGKRARTEARKALWARLRAVARAARGAAAGKPKAKDAFQIPKRRSDDALLRTATSFIDAGEALNGRWVEFGLPETTVAELRDMTAAFVTALDTRREGRIGVGVARGALNDAFEYGFAAVRHLDIIVANTYAPDSAIAAEWKLVRRESPSSHAKDAAPGTAVAAPTTPAADSVAAPAVVPAPEGDPLRRAS